MGVEKLYLHLDGWAQPGYDNCHPDYSPACIEAGGWEGMKELADTMRMCGATDLKSIGRDMVVTPFAK